MHVTLSSGPSVRGLVYSPKVELIAKDNNFNMGLFSEIFRNLFVRTTNFSPSSESLRPQKWKLSKANWNKFEILCEQTITRDKFGDCDDTTKLFTSLLIDAAKQSVPQTLTNLKHPNKPWYYEDCKQAVKDRKQALRKFILRPTKENRNLFRISRAKARRTIRESKRKAWRQNVLKIKK